MERLLQYLSTHRNYGIRYYASNMQLQVQSNASYLCRPRARSVSGGLFYLGTTVAIGLANDTINKKRSKSMDMRFFWLRDRVAQQQFVVEHIPGQYNVAAFFTKALPTSKYDQFHRYLVFNRDCMEEKRPKKKLKTITMDKTL